MSDAAIILAAGKGTRMRSDLPKVLHEVAGRPMVAYVIEALRNAGFERVYVVVGYRAQDVMDALERDNVVFVRQEQQLGTGHAVMQCQSALHDVSGTVMVLNGDVPGLRTGTIREFRGFHEREEAAATVLTAVVDTPGGYGRIVRDDAGALAAIVEEKDADEGVRAITEINSGLFCFDKMKLFEALQLTGRDNAQGEYYLTDVVSVLKGAGDRVLAYRAEDADEVAGVNTDDELEAVRRMMRDRRP